MNKGLLIVVHTDIRIPENFTYFEAAVDNFDELNADRLSHFGPSSIAAARAADRNSIAVDARLELPIVGTGGLSPDERQERNDRIANPASDYNTNGPGAAPGNLGGGGANFGSRPSSDGSSGGSGGTPSLDVTGDNDAWNAGVGSGSSGVSGNSDYGNSKSNYSSAGYNHSTYSGNTSGSGRGRAGSGSSASGSNSRGSSGVTASGKGSGRSGSTASGSNRRDRDYDCGFGRDHPSVVAGNGRLTGRVPILLDLDGIASLSF